MWILYLFIESEGKYVDELKVVRYYSSEEELKGCGYSLGEWIDIEVEEVKKNDKGKVVKMLIEWKEGE